MSDTEKPRVALKELAQEAIRTRMDRTESKHGPKQIVVPKMVAHGKAMLALKRKATPEAILELIAALEAATQPVGDGWKDKSYLDGPMMPAWENRNPDQRNAFCQWVDDLRCARSYNFEDEWGKLRAMLSASSAIPERHGDKP